MTDKKVYLGKPNPKQREFMAAGAKYVGYCGDLGKGYLQLQRLQSLPVIR